jgi:peptidyl-tRNA hydrolase
MCVSPATPSGKVRKPSGEKAIVDFLMGKFRKPEEEKLAKIAKRAGDIVETILADGLQRAMSEHN